MLNKRAQAGVGMIEVLVALGLLAIGVLGYVALQVRAVSTSQESMMRSHAMLIMRSLAESMRVNGTAQGSYLAQVQAYTSITTGTTAPTPSCTGTSSCTGAQVAAQDAYQVALSALQRGIRLTMADCPGVNSVPKRQCIFAAWGKTTLGAAGDYSNCMSTSGVYVTGSTCMMMEAY